MGSFLEQSAKTIENSDENFKRSSTGGLKASRQRGGRTPDSYSPCVARLIEPARRVPATPVESLVVSLLKEAKEVPCDRLISRVADNLYRGELRSGAWAIDIGLFGSNLFVADALRAVEGGNGELWEIANP